jgi:uncharacterized membrane protein
MPDHDARASHQAKLQFERLVFFSDAVFAIAITLLVLDLRIPVESKGVINLAVLGPKLFGFGLSFAVIGVYWLHHHALFGTIVREDPLLRVTNLVFLATVVFLPFPTSVIAEFPTTTNSVTFYALSVAAVGTMATLLSLVARRSRLRDLGEGAATSPGFVIRSFTTPIIFIASAAVATTRPRLAMEMWWLVAPAIWISRHLGQWLEGRQRDRARSLTPPG